MAKPVGKFDELMRLGGPAPLPITHSKFTELRIGLNLERNNQPSAGRQDVLVQAYTQEPSGERQLLQ